MAKHKIDIEHRMNDTKLLWHMDRVHKHYRDGKRIAPLYIDMGASKRCNIKCIYCYGLYQTFTGEIIQRDALVNLFKEVPEIGIKGIGLVGDGEPTCNPYIYEAMDEGKKRGLDIAISTNGVLLDDEKMKNILRNCVWMRFNLSAGTREGYKKIHGIDKWDLVTKNIKRMVELKDIYGYTCEIGLQSVFVPTIMKEEMIKEAQFAVDSGVNYFLIKQCSLPDEGQSGMIQFDLSLYNSLEIQEVLKKCEDMSTEKTKIIVKWHLMEQEGRRPYDKCVGIPLLLQISGNGKVYPCGYLFGRYNDKYLMGDLHKNSIKEIVFSDRYWEVIEMMKNFDVHKGCRGCCRQDKVNEFVWEYLHPPKGINFI